jgi:hypothetical protein
LLELLVWLWWLLLLLLLLLPGWTNPACSAPVKNRSNASRIKK